MAYDSDVMDNRVGLNLLYGQVSKFISCVNQLLMSSQKSLLNEILLLKEYLKNVVPKSNEAKRLIKRFCPWVVKCLV